MMTIVWFIVWAAIFRGPKQTGRIVWFTAVLPIITIFVLVIVGVTLDGADIGLTAFIGKFDVQ